MTILDPNKKPKPGRPKNEQEIPFDQMTESAQILHLYNDGKFDSGVCAGVGISKDTFNRRIDEDEQFKELISFGRTLCQAQWEEAFNIARKGGKIPAATMVNFAMKNMFGWAEKTETTNSDLLQIEGLTREEAMEKIQKLLPSIVNIAEAREKKRA